jgi:hypothetical protein
MEFAHWFKTAIPRMLLLALMLLAGCGGSSGSTALPTPAPLSASNLNLIFVVSEDVAFHAAGDIDPATANLTDQGLQRSLRMATFLKRKVLGRKNVTAVYALEPMTHLQTTGAYPDMAALESIQQFALLNRITLSSAVPPQFIPYTGHSYPINASYAPSVPLPSGVATPTASCPNCQGLDFADAAGDNETLLSGIITANVPGFYVFSAPWETISTLLANLNTLEGYKLTPPTSYAGPNFIYAIPIEPSGSAGLVIFNSNLRPPSVYPALPRRVPLRSVCTAQPPFAPITVTIGTDGAVTPSEINRNETLYIIRHADAHPLPFWTDGNYVCAGQWRALSLPKALRGKIIPQQVYSSDPAQISPGTQNSWSGVAPSLTAEPYAIANNLPYRLAASFPETSTTATSDFFFTGGQFSNQSVLLAWSYQFIQPTVNALLASYFPGGVVPNPVPAWPGDDYDSIWTITLDGGGNLTIDNSMCEGIDSATLPATCPEF